MTRQHLEQRVTKVVEVVLAEQRFVSAIDVLVGLGWLAPSHLDNWRQGRVETLEQIVQANLAKITAAMAAFRRWAQNRGLNPSETDYIARTRDRRQLRFSVSADAAIARAYRTHWVSPDLSRDAIKRQSRPPDLVVISPLKEWTCTSCGGTGELLFMEDAGPHCLDCADLGHLDFLPSGDAALTRRTKKISRLTAVVVRWSRSRKRYERQASSPRQRRLKVPNRNASPTPSCGPAAGSATKCAGQTRMRGSRLSLPTPSASCFRIVLRTAPRRSHATRRHALAAGSDEPRPDGPWIRTRYGSP